MDKEAVALSVLYWFVVLLFSIVVAAAYVGILYVGTKIIKLAWMGSC